MGPLPAFQIFSLAGSRWDHYLPSNCSALQDQDVKITCLPTVQPLQEQDGTIPAFNCSTLQDQDETPCLQLFSLQDQDGTHCLRTVQPCRIKMGQITAFQLFQPAGSRWEITLPSITASLADQDGKYLPSNCSPLQDKDETITCLQLVSLQDQDGTITCLPTCSTLQDKMDSLPAFQLFSLARSRGQLPAFQLFNLW
ncbi:hypothetical protein AVEN_37435-1 [Araneus ventricosus]|uniref:Uncharacterized protein n=1 Tax=Araneus ventricosus TaxID=182803 RepID=A0A4Y2FBC2_ARAVE|nr:hypothetical protein AVEN_37435-1 [Araneus ventricosus]